MKSFQLNIDYQCPQCGAPAVLEETDRLFECAYCRVKSYLVPRGIFQYRFADCRPAASRELLFFPYWRFKGALFSCTSQGIEHRIMDLTCQAFQSPDFPVSLGFRSQVLRLQFLSDDIPGTFLKPEVSINQALGLFKKRFTGALDDPAWHESFLGETSSLIYAPFYVQDHKIHDGILDRAVSGRLPEEFRADRLAAITPEKSLRFFAALCPNCGWDLEGRRDALVLLCFNCESAWKTSRQGLRHVSCAHLPAQGERAGSLYLPFWRISAKVTEIQLDSYADLIRVANLPQPGREKWGQAPFYFWSPAFKIRPRMFLRLSRALTLAHPPEGLVPQIPAGRLHPVNLPLAQAAAGLKVSLAGFSTPKNVPSGLLKEAQITPKSFSLVYVPFADEHHEYVHGGTGMAISKNMLRLSDNL
ncbi:MAG: hypothetical protein Q8P24_00055 [Desulfobacterales bacterium]|nr:hypothetical protein [Desulfobacterales bacterium]